MKERFKGFDVSINPSKFLLILIDKGTLRERRKVRNLHYNDPERCYRRGKIDRPLICRSLDPEWREKDLRSLEIILVFRYFARMEKLESSRRQFQTPLIRLEGTGRKEKRKKERKTPIKSSIKSIDDP